MAEKRSVYLSSQALGMPRRCDSLSGRINQVCGRYDALMRQHAPPVRAMFTAAEWSTLLDACAAWPALDCLAALDAMPDAHARLASLSAADRCALAELLEADL